uniref:Apple domain-containing protein n=1 Tax=Elaeophora elaphi TaxID=1147741 RepID=A0A0R3RLA6_9BILA
MPLLDSNPSSSPFELTSILGHQIDDAFSNLIHLEKQQMGISIPKYNDALAGIIIAQMPKHNGVSTVMINTAGGTIDRGISIKREITEGKILEEQKSLINGKPVTLELWNPIIYGHDWLASPGAIIHGKIRPLQAEVRNIDSRIEGRKSRHQQKQMFSSRFISNDIRMNRKSKQKTKPRKGKTIATNQMGQKEKLLKACHNDEKNSTGGNNDEESNVLIITIEKSNDLIENNQQGTEKYHQQQQSRRCFYVMNNCTLSATAPFERRIGISLIECAQFCSSLFGCLSASYSTRFSICDTYHFKFGLRGKKVMKLAWHYYLEPQANNTPGCSIEQIAELCDGALIERQPQHVLITFPDAILTTSTLAKCLLKCLWSFRDGRAFQCHSLMYFYKQKVDNCILNSRSRKNSPNSLKEETIAIVDYFGLDECQVFH